MRTVQEEARVGMQVRAGLRAEVQARVVELRGWKPPRGW